MRRRLERGLAAIRDTIGGVIGAFKPEEGTTEGSVYLGLLFIGVGIESGHPSLVVPGIVLTFLGSAPVIAALRGKD